MSTGLATLPEVDMKSAKKFNEFHPNPSQLKGENRPVENVNWKQAREFCKRLSKLTGKKYRLPTEA